MRQTLKSIHPPGRGESERKMDTYDDKYECQNCGFQDEVGNLPIAKDQAERHAPGDKFSDVECPHCGALCFPAKDNTEKELHIVVIGNVVDGVRFLGPFDDYDAALAFAESLPPLDDWHIAVLEGVA
jgi:predicted RNA-binding Zn-ribbon protein involved in translation (DUF1610 family)